MEARMTERLKNCDKWHPDTESRLVQHRMRGGFVIRCRECLRIRVMEHRQLGQPYGIIPLNWAPPQL